MRPDSTDYLFGTIHMLRTDTVWRTPHLEEALAEADALWLEINLDAAGSLFTAVACAMLKTRTMFDPSNALKPTC